MDASQYKDYVLVLLFVKYVSDKYFGDDMAIIEVPDGGSFLDMIALKGSPNIGEGINKIIAKLAEANELRGVIDVADFNDPDKLGKGKEMVARLTNLIAIFENPALNFKKNRSDGDDLLGDAYEYLMRNFATQSGKSKGQFYTPAEVSRIMDKVANINAVKSQVKTIYDPTCGSGSLLLKAADEAPKGISIYGQEMDNATRALAQMNMILHGHADGVILQGNTLANPLFKGVEGELKEFDFAVANPPFSAKAWMNGFDGFNDQFKRFDGFGIPPAKNGDYAFFLHLVSSLKNKGEGAIILPHGVLFSGNAEAEIRKNLIESGLIKGIVGLPANLFYGTGIPACIIILHKGNGSNNDGIFMIDASGGFIKDGNKNRLREQDIHKIVDVFTKGLEIAKYSRLVSFEEIKENDYNLNIPRYIDSQQSEDMQDITAHLLGGIPKDDIEALGKYWGVYPSLKGELFEVIREGYVGLRVGKDDIKSTIFNHGEFIAYTAEIENIFNSWKNEHLPLLRGLKVGEHPQQVIHELSESLLDAFSGCSLIDKYDVYQHLMSYWLETMRDDVYILVEDGWVAELTPIFNKKGTVTDYTCELIPKELIVKRYFMEEKGNIESLESQRDEMGREMEEMQEEYGGEEGLLEEVTNDAGNITKTNLTARIKEIKGDREYEEEMNVLRVYLKLMEEQTKLNKQIKDAEKQLNSLVLKQYQLLTAEEVKCLVIDDKWFPCLWESIQSEMERISQRLAQRILELADRYGETLSELENEVNLLTNKVEEHLKLII